MELHVHITAVFVRILHKPSCTYCNFMTRMYFHIFGSSTLNFTHGDSKQPQKVPSSQTCMFRKCKHVYTQHWQDKTTATGYPLMCNRTISSWPNRRSHWHILAVNFTKLTTFTAYIFINTFSRSAGVVDWSWRAEHAFMAPLVSVFMGSSLSDDKRTGYC